MRIFSLIIICDMLMMFCAHQKQHIALYCTMPMSTAVSIAYKLEEHHKCSAAFYNMTLDEDIYARDYADNGESRELYNKKPRHSKIKSSIKALQSALQLVMRLESAVRLAKAAVIDKERAMENAKMDVEIALRAAITAESQLKRFTPKICQNINGSYT